MGVGADVKRSCQRWNLELRVVPQSWLHELFPGRRFPGDVLRRIGGLLVVVLSWLAGGVSVPGFLVGERLPLFFELVVPGFGRIEPDAQRFWRLNCSPNCMPGCFVMNWMPQLWSPCFLRILLHIYLSYIIYNK